MKTTREKMEELFEELVPTSGKAESKAGEIVRAFARINYRYFNDGDKVGIGYGKETCNPAARFLVHESNDEIADLVAALNGLCNDRAYEAVLEDLESAVCEYVCGHPELRDEETADMFDYRDPNEDVDDDWDEEECWDEGDDW